MAARVFTAKTHQGRSIITREGEKGQVFQIELSPAEADRATEVIGLALQMLDAPIPHITATPFVVRFYADGAFALERTDTTGSIPFRESEGDELITTVQMAHGMTLNEQTHGRVVPSMTPPSPHMVGDEPL